MAKNQKKAAAPAPVKSETAAPRTNPFAGMESWLSGKSRWLAAAIFLISLALYGTIFQQVRDTPLQSMSRWDQSDMHFFDQSARWVANGHWLSDTILHPYHDWHNTYTKLYFEKYPEIASRYYSRHLNEQGVADTMAARYDMLSDVFQGKVYYQEPLYVYLMAATYRWLGADQNWVFLWQILLAALSNVLVFWIGRRHFGTGTGLLAAILVMVSGPIVVYAFTLLRSTLTTFLTLSIVFAYQKLLDHNNVRTQLLFGATAGLSLLNQSYFILFILPAIAWYVWTHRQHIRQVSKGAGVVVGGLLLVMAPLFIRNIMVGVPMGAMASAGGLTYILFNSSKSEPLESNFIHHESTVKLMHDSGGKLLPAVSACLQSFDSFGDLLQLYKKKMGGLFMWFEVPNNMSYYMYKEFSPLLEDLPAPYRFMAPLGICGLFFGFWRLRWRFIPLFLVILMSAAPLFISASLARYRMPFATLMTLMAAFFILDLLQNILTLKWKEAVAGVGLLALAWFYTSGIRKLDFFPYYATDIMPIYILHYRDRFVELEKEKDDEKYLALTTDLLKYIPDYFWEIKNTHHAKYSNESGSCNVISNLFRMHAATLKKLGRDAESARYYERVDILTNIVDEFNRKVKK